MKLKRLCLLVGFAVPAAVFARPAESPSTDTPAPPARVDRPQRKPATARPRVLKHVNACEDQKKDAKGEKADKGRKQPWRWDVSEEEKQAARQFFQDHSPRRWEAYQSLSEEERRNVWGKMIGRYKMIQFFARDEDVRVAKVRQVELEDEIYGLKRELLRAPAGQDEAVKTRLREKVTELLARQMDERAAHISRLEKLLQGEKERFLEDVQNRDAILEEMYRQELERKPAVAPEEPKKPERPGDGGEGRDNR